MNRILMILMAFTMVFTAYAEPENGGKQSKKEAKAQKKKMKREAKPEVINAGRLYIYGLAYSPADSVVYMTDELILDNAQLEKKTKFLVGREILSGQLANHMALKGEKNRICTVTFAETVKKLDKRYAKQVEKLRKRGFLIKHVGQGEFRFSAPAAE